MNDWVEVWVPPPQWTHQAVTQAALPFEKLNSGTAGRGVRGWRGGGVGRQEEKGRRKKNAELSTAPTISFTKEEGDVMVATATTAAMMLLLLPSSAQPN